MLLVLMLSACAPTKIPSTAPADIATIVAATQQAAPSSTASPFKLPTPTPAPTGTSTAVPGTPAAPKRILLMRGATSADIHERIGAGETQAYAIAGAQGQPMIVNLQSTAGDATLFMMSQGGTYFVRPGLAAAWRGTLPQAGDYFLGVYGGATATEYTLSLQQVTRITFKEGQEMKTLAGMMPAGSMGTFILFAIKGEKVMVTLSGAGGKASLAISAFVDSKSYLDASSGETQYTLVVPATTDYIIELVPSTQQDIDYILDLKIE